MTSQKIPVTLEMYFQFLRNDLHWLAGFAAGIKGGVEAANALLTKVEGMRSDINRLEKGQKGEA